MQSIPESATIEEKIEDLHTSLIELHFKVDGLTQKGGLPKKVTGSIQKIEDVIRQRKKIGRAELQRIVGASDSEISRDLKLLESEGKIVRRQDSKDSRKIVCIWNTELESQNVTDEDLPVLELVNTCPHLPYNELARKSGARNFKLSYNKLLAHGLIDQTHNNGHLYSVVTAKGLHLMGCDAVG